jgi:cyanophycin synthetase
VKKNCQKPLQILGYPLVVKPLNGNQGKGATIGIKNWTEAREAFKLAQGISKEVIIEKYIVGFDFRFLVINYKVVAVAKRTPAYITVDGNSTIQELIDIVNSDPRRGCNHENVLMAITVDESTKSILEEKHLTFSSVLQKDEVLYIKKTANLSTGGTATDITDQVHPGNIYGRTHCLDCWPRHLRN